MRLRRASKTAIVLVSICLIIQLIEGVFGLWTTINRISQDLDSIYLLISILYVVTGLVEIAPLLIIFGVLSCTREQLLCPCPADSPGDDLAYQPSDDSHIRLRQNAGMAVVLVAVSLAMVVLTHLVYLGRLLPFLGRGFWSSYALCALLSLIGSMLMVTAVLIVFKSLARDREQLMRDEPIEPPVIDATAGGGKLRFGAIAAMLLVIVSLIMSTTVTALDLSSMMERDNGHIDAIHLVMTIMGEIGGLMMDVSLLMVFASLLRIKEPLIHSEPDL
jgi:hypothetical protein